MLSRADRLRGLFRLGWAVQTHFANFDLVPDLDWEQAVIAIAPAVQRAESLSDYYRTLQRLRAQVCQQLLIGPHDQAVSLAVAGRLTDRPLTFERARTRQTISSLAANGWSAMTLEIDPDVQPPRPRPFLGPLAVLIGPLTASAAEDFLVGLAGRELRSLVNPLQARPGNR